MTDPSIGSPKPPSSQPMAADEDDGDSRLPLRHRILGSLGFAMSGSPNGQETPPPSPEQMTQENTDRQKVLLNNVQRMGEMRVSDAMVPRADVVGTELDASYDEVVAAFRKEGHSRLPVYRETLDDAEGFIHVKDVFMLTSAGVDAAQTGDFSVRRYMRRILTVPPSMRCGILLQKMQADRVHMALVIDEYGGVDGLVTIEDLLELIVGEIEDEHDATVEAVWKKQDEGIYRVEARAYLDDFQEETGVSLIEAEKIDDVDTLGGLVFTLCNRIPARGEVIRHPDGHEFEILDADPRRIKRMLVTLNLYGDASDGDETLQAAQ